MARTGRADWRRIKTHRSYTVEEAARTLGVTRGTVRRWVKNGLSALTDRKPMLILGGDLKAYLRNRQPPPQKLDLDQFLCMSCKVPRRLAFGDFDILNANDKTINVEGLCKECATHMCKRVSRKRFAEFEALVRVPANRGTSL